MNNPGVRHVNYATDFRVVFAFPDNELPNYPWRLELSTPNTPAYNTYEVSFDGQVYKRCVPLKDKSILVLVDNHKLAPGILCYKMKRDIPDDLFPDGEMNVTTPGCTSIELWYGDTEELPIESLNTIIATLKGDPGEAGTIESITVTVDDTRGIPHAEVEMGGTPVKRTFTLRFSGLKGETPLITADSTGILYADGEMLTDVLHLSAEASAEQTARVEALADHPPRIVTEQGNGYWAFWDEASQQYVTSSYRSDDGMLLETLPGADVALDVVGGREYICGTLTSLRLVSVAASPRLSIVRFRSGAAPTEFTYPDSLAITGWTIPQAETTYDLFIWQGAATIVYR